MTSGGPGATIRTGMVLAAGFGTRMRPLTDGTPKPLIRLAGKCLLDHALDRFAAAGIERAVVNVHYCADQIEKQLRGRLKPQIVISDERDSILETGGGVMKALPHLGPDPFIVQNADTVWTEGSYSNLAMLMAAWRPGTMAGLLLLAERDSSIGYEGRGDFHLEAGGRLRRKAAGEDAPFVFAGVSVLKPQLFGGLAEKAFSLNAIFDRALSSRALFGAVLKGTWMHVGTPEALSQAENVLNEGQRRTA
jgi:MurNAc alpha-1-phosphate uridylyltransferase